MLSISSSTRPKRVTPNILPCEISYTGKVDASKHYWNPQDQTVKGETNSGNGKQVQVAYFRGRKLLGRTAALPDGYRGVIVSGEKSAVVQRQNPEQGSAFSRIARRSPDDNDDDYNREDDENQDGDEDDDDADSADAMDQDAEDLVSLESMDEISTFQEITVWEHEVVPGAEEPFSRGIQEWLAFAQVVHGAQE